MSQWTGRWKSFCISSHAKLFPVRPPPTMAKAVCRGVCLPGQSVHRAPSLPLLPQWVLQGLTGPSTGACHLCRRACSTEKVSYLLHVWMMWPHGCDSLLNVCLMYPMCLSWYSYLFKIPMVSLCFKLHDRCHFRLHLNKIEIICRHRHFCYFVRDNTTDILFEVKTG